MNDLFFIIIKIVLFYLIITNFFLVREGGRFSSLQIRVVRGQLQWRQIELDDTLFKVSSSLFNSIFYTTHAQRLSVLPETVGDRKTTGRTDISY